MRGVHQVSTTAEYWVAPLLGGGGTCSAWTMPTWLLWNEVAFQIYGHSSTIHAVPNVHPHHQHMPRHHPVLPITQHHAPPITQCTPIITQCMPHHPATPRSACQIIYLPIPTLILDTMMCHNCFPINSHLSKLWIPCRCLQLALFIYRVIDRFSARRNFQDGGGGFLLLLLRRHNDISVDRCRRIHTTPSFFPLSSTG